MPTFVMLTRLMPGGLSSGRSLKHLEQQTMEHIKHECPAVQWKASYALLGPYDYLDIFQAPDQETAAKVSTLVHIHGQAQTETWGAIEWPVFKDMLDRMPAEIFQVYDAS